MKFKAGMMKSRCCHSLSKHFTESLHVSGHHCKGTGSLSPAPRRYCHARLSKCYTDRAGGAGGAERGCGWSLVVTAQLKYQADRSQALESNLVNSGTVVKVLKLSQSVRAPLK